ncbi:hypothetical protein HY029_01015 [Candidatus Gottesmanbacteria bacterium]|nr:hypothetical protein [Candidatus Gottesmanbacteria bacterium]
MDKMMKECMKPHALLHTVTGVGLGMLLSNWLGLAGEMGMWWGVGLIVVGVVGEFMIAKK